jgi:hypothetical protein
VGQLSFATATQSVLMKFASKAKSFAGNVVKRQKKTTKNEKKMAEKWFENGRKKGR